MICSLPFFFFFFFNDTATTEIYTLSLHDALPISAEYGADSCFSKLRYNASNSTTRRADATLLFTSGAKEKVRSDRKSTRLNSSHSQISYAVFCLKKKNTKYVDDNTIIPTMHERTL